MNPRAAITELLSQRRIALLGPAAPDALRVEELWRRLEQRGHEVEAFELSPAHFDRVGTLRPLREMPRTLDAAVVLCGAEDAPAAVRACIAAGVRRVWLHREDAHAPLSHEAVQLCAEAGLSYIPGQSLLAFLDETSRPPPERQAGPGRVPA